MTSVTIITVPKAFTGRTAVMQENAIRSWQRLVPGAEIILFGDDPGVADAARRLGVRHVPEVAKNEYGTPLLHDVFNQADRLATHDILCFVNGDIVFLNDFSRQLDLIGHSKFLVVGQRFDMAVVGPIDFTNPAWNKELYERLVSTGSFLTMGMDYFLYRRGLYAGMPDFAIGRGSWDSWLVWSALDQGVPVIDATRQILALHQNHDYAHLKASPEGAYWKGVEGKRNLILSGFDKVRPPNFYDARFVLTEVGPRPATGFLYRAQRLYAFTSRHKVLYPLRILVKLGRKIGPMVHRFRKPHRVGLP